VIHMSNSGYTSTMTCPFRFTSFPKTKPSPPFVHKVFNVFAAHEITISTRGLAKGLESDRVIQMVGPDLEKIGFEIELEKKRKIPRPVFFGEMGMPSLRYDIDGYHKEWRCGIEVEAGRALGGNAIFRDLFQAMVMTDIDHLILAVPLCYRRKSGGKLTEYEDYRKTVSIAEALYGHDRIRMPYGLSIIGY
jgi:hypothetical protein